MRIAIFTNNYLPNPFGVSTSIESFRKEFEKQGHTVYIFAPLTKGYTDENPNVFRYPSIDINYKISFPLGIPFSFAIAKKLTELEIDIIHSQHPNLIGWAARRWARKKRVPLVFTWHTLYDKYAHFAPLVPRKLAAWWTISNARRYANKCDQVVVPTPSVEKIIRAWDVTNKNIIAIPTGISQENFSGSDRSIIRGKFGISESQKVIIWIARFTEEKNTRFLFQTVARVLKEHKDVCFIAGGEGYLYEEMKSFVEREKLSDRVFMPGFISNEEKKNYYAAGDVYVNASTSETQGIIICEAMYMGLPSVVVDASGVRDLVTNQVTGLLVKEDEQAFATAVERLVSDDALRQRFSENAKKIAHENYTAPVCAQRMLSLYEEVITRTHE